MMCTLITLKRPRHPWPLLIAGNRDEMNGRPFLPPGRHWPELPDITGGMDRLSGGTWAAMNDDGVVAVVLNQENSLGPQTGKRSRGELVLEALSHADAREALENLQHLNLSAYRPFHLFMGDNRDSYFLSSNGVTLSVTPVPDGLSLMTASGLNDMGFSRTRYYLPLFEKATPPEPQTGDFQAWESLLRSAEAPDPAAPYSAMNFEMPSGFATLCHQIFALPAIGSDQQAVYRFAPRGEDFQSVIDNRGKDRHIAAFKG